jgi:hypothetical protein
MALVGALIVVLLLANATPDALRVATVFLALAALVASLSRRMWPLGCAGVVAAWWLAVVLGRYLPDLINPWPSVANTVGGAAYFGTPYQGPQIGAVLSVAIPILLAFAAVAFVAIRAHRAGRIVPVGSAAAPRAAPDAPHSAETARRHAAVVTWLGAAIVVFTLVPNLRDWLHQETTPLAYGWDVSNLTAWQGFVEMGLVPMKDFFYPYGFQWLYGLRSIGPLFQWLTQIAMLAAAAWALRQLTGGRTVRVLACLVAVALVGAWSPYLWRYLPAFLVPVMYGALGPAVHGHITRDHWIFGGVCLLAGLIEPDLLALGLVGVACVLAGELVAGRLSWDRGRLLLRGAVDLSPVVAAGVILIVSWVVTGTTAGNLRFYTEFSSVSASSAPDEKLYGPAAMLFLHPNEYSTLAAIPALLCVVGLLWARFGDRESRALPTILLGGAGVSLTLLLKNYVRPISDLVLLPGLVALAWSLILVWGRGSLARALIWGAAAAAMLCLLNESAGTTHYLDTAVSSPVNAARSIGVVLDLGARARAADAEFSTGRFGGWPDTANAAFYEASIGNNRLRFAIVGDSPMTYVLLRQAPPYQIDMYDAGRIAEERAMLSDLRARPPWYVIWSKSFFQDGVPYNVRDPLIFSWLIDNYVPYRVSPATDILRRRRPGEAIPAAFWSSQLGDDVDLEYIPSGSDAAQAPRCSGGLGCVRYAIVRGHAAPGSMVNVHVSGDGHSYPFSFRVRGGVSVYPVRLDRLWFSAMVGPSPTVTTTTPGFTASGAARRSGANLY